MKYLLRLLRGGVIIFQRTLYLLTLGHFPPPFVSVNVIICDGDKALLIDRRDGLGLGLPGGFVGLKEKVEDAAAREVKEETGLEVELAGLVTTMSGKRRGSYIYATCLVYEARITGDKVTRDSLEGKCRWIPLHQIEAHRFAIDHFDALKLFRESKSHESADLKTNLRS